jgi:integrase
LRSSSIRWSHGRWTLRVKVKGGRERTLPLPAEVKRAIDDYLRLDASRRRNLHSGGESERFLPTPSFGPISGFGNCW